MKHDLTAQEMSALRAFARAHGSRWKAVLRRRWLNSTASPTLMRLRSKHGPSWLAGFNFPTKAMKAGKSRTTRSMGARGTSWTPDRVSAVIAKLEQRVEVLEHNDGATYGLLLGMANASRTHHGKAPIKALPGFVMPRMYTSKTLQIGAQSATASMSRGRIRRKKAKRVIVRQLGSGF